MAISIDVRYYVSVIKENLFSYDLKVVVVNAVDMPKEIFIFQREVGTTVPPLDRFTCIADPVDLEEVPVGSPDLPNEMPYYRTDTVLLRFRDMLTLQECQALMDSDIQMLVNSLKAAAALELMTEKTYA